MQEQSHLHLCRGTRAVHSWRPHSAYPPCFICHFASSTLLLPSCRSSWDSLASRSSTLSRPKRAHTPRQVPRKSSDDSKTASLWLERREGRMKSVLITPPLLFVLLAGTTQVTG